MVSLIVAGQKVAWVDAEKLFAETAAKQPIEFCDENGRVIATSVPGTEPVGWYDPPVTPPSNPRPTEPGYTLDEWRRGLGWDW
jgi:hypothetical protein